MAQKLPIPETLLTSKPVTDFVGSGVAEVVLGQAATGNGGREDNNTVVVVSGRAGGDSLGEVGVTKVTGTRHEVNVEVSVGALAERPLHGQLGLVVGPGGVNGPVSTSLSK